MFSELSAVASAGRNLGQKKGCDGTIEITAPDNSSNEEV
jgi:hypothetical protein